MEHPISAIFVFSFFGAIGFNLGTLAFKFFSMIPITSEEFMDEYES